MGDGLSRNPAPSVRWQRYDRSRDRYRDRFRDLAIGHRVELVVRRAIEQHLLGGTEHRLFERIDTKPEAAMWLAGRWDDSVAAGLPSPIRNIKDRYEQELADLDSLIFRQLRELLGQIAQFAGNHCPSILGKPLGSFGATP